MKHIYFVNERIRLRAMEPEDLELICEMENDPQKQVFLFLTHQPFFDIVVVNHLFLLNNFLYFFDKYLYAFDLFFEFH